MGAFTPGLIQLRVAGLRCPRILIQAFKSSDPAVSGSQPNAHSD